MDMSVKVETIVVLHPGAIGDVVMGTPSAMKLKERYPDAKLIYFTHASLFPLLRLSSFIDQFVEWDGKQSLYAQLKQLKDLQATLLVDFTSSTRTRLLRLLCGARFSVGLRKQRRTAKPVQHLVDLFILALKPLGISSTEDEQKFPSLKIDEVHADLAWEKLAAALNEECISKNPGAPATISKKELVQKEIIALVPGVGKHRPNRAWPKNSWVELANELLSKDDVVLVLIGGADDQELCAQVAESVAAANLVNFAGILLLPETVAMLSLCNIVISADTGPAHLATAIGRPVVCLMGPTLPERTGPYRQESIGINACHQCRCQNAKHCLVESGNGEGGGACMATISVSDVFKRAWEIRQGVLSLSASKG